MEKRDFTIHIDGHPGHRGNVLAHAFVKKVGKILTALAQAERRYSGRTHRQTDYEIVDASKVNPTNMTLRPVSKAMNYDPLPAFEWTFEQIERIALGGDVDKRIDEELASTLADVAKKDREDEYGRLWITREHGEIRFDEAFLFRSSLLAQSRRIETKPSRWFEGTSLGTVTGDLREVADLEGERRFILIPPVGPDQIECVFPEEKREQMRLYLFRTVRVNGKIHYRESSPFPALVEMESIEAVSTDTKPKHLLDMRGLFKGRERYKDNLEAFLNGL